MSKQKIVKKRITPKILAKLYPQSVADKIIEIANEYGDEGEMGIKSFVPQTVDTNHFWHTREGDKYVVMDADGKEISVEMSSQNVVGAANVSSKLNRKFQLPAGTFLITVTYYKKYYMNVYTCKVAKKLGPVNKDLVSKLENTADTKVAIVDDIAQEPALILPDAVLHLPKLDSETGEVIQAEIEEKSGFQQLAEYVVDGEQLSDDLINPIIGDVADNPEKYNIQTPERNPVVLQPRKRRTEPLTVQPITSAKKGSALKSKSPDGDNLYHGEVVIVGIGENEGKEINATMKIGGRKWICLSGGWECDVEVDGKKLYTGNMKEIMNVWFTHFLRTDGAWKGNKAGNGWVIREDWFKKIIETK